MDDGAIWSARDPLDNSTFTNYISLRAMHRCQPPCLTGEVHRWHFQSRYIATMRGRYAEWGCPFTGRYNSVQQTLDFRRPTVLNPLKQLGRQLLFYLIDLSYADHASLVGSTHTCFQARQEGGNLDQQEKIRLKSEAGGTWMLAVVEYVTTYGRVIVRSSTDPPFFCRAFFSLP